MARTIYKQATLESAKNRPTTALDTTKKAQASTIVSNFIAHLKAKHS